MPRRSISVGAEIAADFLKSKVNSIGCSSALLGALSPCWQTPLFAVMFEPKGVASPSRVDDISRCLQQLLQHVRLAETHVHHS